jgi:hypothetical protein
VININDIIIILDVFLTISNIVYYYSILVVFIIHTSSSTISQIFSFY